ncbi:MAG: VanZ family protein, partial [Clostridia bacterium]|nr:VanZ family protein [Clostridia bacterium]
VPFWSYVASVKYYYALDVFMQILENIGIFVPIGFLLPFLFGKKGGAKTVILTAFFLSLFAEICQLVFSLGVCETDDLFNNTLGAVVGYGFYRSMTACKIKGKRLCVTDEKRFLKGFLPFLSVYEIMVLMLVLREAVACLN